MRRVIDIRENPPFDEEPDWRATSPWCVRLLLAALQLKGRRDSRQPPPPTRRTAGPTAVVSDILHWVVLVLYLLSGWIGSLTERESRLALKQLQQ